MMCNLYLLFIIVSSFYKQVTDVCKFDSYSCGGFCNIVLFMFMVVISLARMMSYQQMSRHCYWQRCQDVIQDFLLKEYSGICH